MQWLKIHINQKKIVESSFDNATQFMNGIDFLMKHGVLETKPSFNIANVFDTA